MADDIQKRLSKKGFTGAYLRGLNEQELKKLDDSGRSGNDHPSLTLGPTIFENVGKSKVVEEDLIPETSKGLSGRTINESTTSNASSFPSFTPAEYPEAQEGDPKFDPTELAGKLKTAATSYEQLLDGIEDKEEEKQNRLAMKSLFKGFIDIAAQLYIAQNAPTANYKGITDPKEYKSDLDRLERKMAMQRGLIKEKFAELRTQYREESADKEKAVDKLASQRDKEYKRDVDSRRDNYTASVDKWKAENTLSQQGIKNTLERDKLDAKSTGSGGPDPKLYSKEMDLSSKLLQKFLEELPDMEGEEIMSEGKALGMPPSDIIKLVNIRGDKSWNDFLTGENIKRLREATPEVSAIARYRIANNITNLKTPASKQLIQNGKPVKKYRTSTGKTMEWSPSLGDYVEVN